MTSLLHEPPQLEEGVSALAGAHHGRQLTPVATLVEDVGQAEQRHDVVSQHDRTLRPHVEAPQEIKEEVSEANDHDDRVELCALLSEVAEWPGADHHGRDETERGGESPVECGDGPAVPLGGAATVEEVEEEVEVGPEEKAAQHS